MIALVGASASGKTELAKQLFQTYGYTKCITTTTRKPRIGEKNGFDYHFLSVDEFKSCMDENRFYEVTQYQDHFYGIQKKDVNEEGVVIVDPRGANTLVDKAKEDVFVVYIETSPDIRKKRMELRKDDPKIIEKRLLNDAHVFNKEAFKRIDLHMINDDHQLVELAHLVHQAYQTYLKQR